MLTVSIILVLEFWYLLLFDHNTQWMLTSNTHNRKGGGFPKCLKLSDQYFLSKKVSVCNKKWLMVQIGKCLLWVTLYSNSTRMEGQQFAGLSLQLILSIRSSALLKRVLMSWYKLWLQCKPADCATCLSTPGFRTVYVSCVCLLWSSPALKWFNAALNDWKNL